MEVPQVERAVRGGGALAAGADLEHPDHVRKGLAGEGTEEFFASPGLDLNLIRRYTSVLLGAASDSAWAILASLGRVWFMKPARAKLLGRLSGLALIGGGIWLSLSRRPA